jgi:hypothetical protein
MGTRTAIAAVASATLVALGGCGGGEPSGDENVSIADVLEQDGYGPPDINIGTPSITGYYVTTAEYVHLAGTTSDWDAEIRWGNDVGYAGTASPVFEWCWQCRYDWSADVPLAMGENTLTIVIRNDDGEGEALIHITRQAAWAWRR